MSQVIKIRLVLPDDVVPSAADEEAAFYAAFGALMTRVGDRLTDDQKDALESDSGVGTDQEEA